MSQSQKYVCIHGHFYQPPRENPWLEAIEMQDSAFPFHDWNERITFECYATNTASRILSPEQDIVDIVNNYARMSFNFGPTLLSWLEQQEPDAYRAILQADRDSRDTFSGHGSALAQVYNHIIMPLANRRDKETQIRWGIRDFESRFGRPPEGMWLAETAVDTETLDLLAQNGIAFTVLAPRQARAVRPLGASGWTDVSGDRVNPRVPYRYSLPSGRSIVLFFYDGLVSQDVAFKGLLKNGQQFADRLMQAFPGAGPEPQLVHIATDGESYGHHHRHGDMALAYCLRHIETHSLARITNYGEFLSKFPPAYEAQLYENSSWSCVHGVERWRSDCGCNSGGTPQWRQHWRAPLRQALDWLRDELAPLFEQGMGALAPDPWAVRNDYIEVVLDRSPDTVRAFAERHMGRAVAASDAIRFVKLLEMQRHAQLMYTSCGWFFDEVSGIETIQVLQYASRAIQLAQEVLPAGAAGRLEEVFLQKLAAVPSNVPEYGNAAVLYARKVTPARLDLRRVGAQYAITSLFEAQAGLLPLYSYLFDSEVYDRLEAGVQKLAVGRATVTSVLTLEQSRVSFVVLHLGQQTLITHAREDMPPDMFAEMHRSVCDAFGQGQIGEAIHLMDAYFGTELFSLQSLPKDEQRKVLNRIMQYALESVETAFRQVYEHNYHMMSLLNRTETPLPAVFKTAIDVVVQADLRLLFEDERPSLEEFRRLAAEVGRWQVKLDKDTIGFAAVRRLNGLMRQLEVTPSVGQAEYLAGWVEALKKLPLQLDFWVAQNSYFFIGHRYYGEIRDLAGTGDPSAVRWLAAFNKTGELLDVKIV